VIVAYAIACPLITPIGRKSFFIILIILICKIGLIYMFIKRAVDKYNLVFVYDTEIADKSVHRLAGNFIIIALIIQQLTLLFFVLVRSGLKLIQIFIRLINYFRILETLTYISMTLLGSFILTST
jgi:uncharacterized membrane protein